jgi:hypothetical protein
MSDTWNPHEDPPDPWLRPLWEDPDFIAENGLLEPFEERPMPSASRRSAAPAVVLPPEPEEIFAMAEAEAALGELRGELRTVPRHIAEGALRRMSFKEAAAYLHVAADWIHPCDLALRAMGATGSVLAAARAGSPRTALPVTFASASQVPHDESTAWATIIDHHAEAGMFLARSLARMWSTTLDGRRPLPASDRLQKPVSDEEADPLRLRERPVWMDAALMSGGSADALPSAWRMHAFGAMWRHRELDAAGLDAVALGRLVLGLAAVFVGPGRGPWVLPWLSRLPQRHRRVEAAFDLFLDMPNRRKAWFQSVRDAAREGMATLGALRDVAGLVANHPKLRDTQLRGRLIETVLRDAVATVGSLTRSCGMERQTALSGLLALEREGILREMTGRTRYRVWSCAF